MKNLFAKLFFSLLIFSVACGPQPAAEEEAASEEPQEAPAEEPSAEPSFEGPYQITVLDAGPSSPRKEMKGTVGDASITINYGSPSVKGRRLFVDVESYGEVWRTGANEQTTIEFSKDVQVEGQAVAAGKYGLFTVPGEDEWVVIISGVTDSWGAGKYAEDKDVLRVNVKPQASTHAEQMDFTIEDGAVVMHWGTIAVPFKIEG